MRAVVEARTHRLAPAGGELPEQLSYNHALELDGGVIRRMPGSRNGERCDGALDLPALIRSVYLSELGRVEEPPLEQHLANWTDKLAGLDAEQARAKMVEESRASAEYQKKAGKIPLEKLVESVYWSELGRKGDRIGSAVLVGHAQTKRGEGLELDPIREWLVKQLRSSDEYQKRTTGGGATEWGDVYWCYNARLNRSFAVVRGFAGDYENRTKYPQTNGRPPYELLGLPTSEEKKVGKDFVQTFERGRFLWNKNDGIRLELDTAKVDRFIAAKAGPRKFVMDAPRRLKETALVDLQPTGTPVRKPRLRVAPSPSGYLHPGNLWMALVNYRLAKQLGAEFLLRFEDTDRASSRPEYVDAAIETLRYAGVEWKEDEVEFQSRRGALYRQEAVALIASGHAYEKNGAIWFKMPETDTMVIDDRAKGPVTVSLKDDDGMRDFVLLRAASRPEDRTATFLLANTVDDAEQEITHVVRGEDHLLNAARQTCLYRALGYPVPEFYHLPHITGDEGGEKLSKRNSSTSVLALKEAGIASEVLVNHLARLGTRSYRDDRVMTMDELSKSFDRFAFVKTPSRLGLEELYRKNKKYLAELDPAQLRKALEAFDPEFMASLSPAAAIALVHGVRGRASTYREAIDMGKFVLEEPKYGARTARTLLTDRARALLGAVARELGSLKSWTLGDLKQRLAALNEREKTTFPEYANALTWALTGAPDGMPLENTMAVLGRDAVLSRIDTVLSNRVTLSPEYDVAAPVETSHPASASARVKEKKTAGVELKGAILQTYLRYAKHLGAPLGEPYRDPSGFMCQRFTKAIVNEHGQVQFNGRPSWVGSPFLVVSHADGKGTTWVGGAPLTEAEGLCPTGNNHFGRPLGSVGDAPHQFRAIHFKMFLKAPEATMVLQTKMFDGVDAKKDWEHRWGFDGRAAFSEPPAFPWPRVGHTLNVPVGEWIDVRLDLTRDLAGVPGSTLGGIAFSGDDGNVLYTDVRLESSGPFNVLETYMKYRHILGEPVHEAEYNASWGQWTQEFDRGWVSQNGQIAFKDQGHWLVGGKLDAWLRSPLALGSTAGEAYSAGDGWEQAFANGVTNDHGWAKFKGHDFWLAGKIQETWVANARELGKPLGPARDDGGGLWTQSFEFGWAATDGRFGIGEKAPPARSELAKIADNEILRESDRPEVYVIRGGAKFHLTDPPTFERMGFDWSKLIVVEPGVLDHVLAVPRDGVVIREEHGTEIYELLDGKKCPTAKPRVEPVLVPDGGLRDIPLGEPI